MKTSRRLLLCSIVTLFSMNNVYSQGFYFNAGGGYGFSSSSISYVDLCQGFNSSYPYYYTNNATPFSFTGKNQSYSETRENTGNYSDTYTSTYQSLDKGFGGGSSFFISAGYSFNQNISVELGFSPLLGTTLQSTYTYQDNYYAAEGGEQTANQNVTNKLTSSTMYRILPAIKFSIPISKFTPYVKAGLILGLGEKLTLSNMYSETGIIVDGGVSFSQLPSTANIGLTASGGLSLGYTGSVGVEYRVSHFISAYGEFNIVSENWSPTNGDITAYQITGDNTPSYVLSSAKFTYSENGTISGSANNSNNNNVVEVNSQYPKQTFSFNSYGFSIGVKFSILNQKAAASSAN